MGKIDEYRFSEGVRANTLRFGHVPEGTIIKAPYSIVGKDDKWREYKVIANYDNYVLCERVSKLGTYLKCFLKSDVYFGTIPREEYQD